MILWFVGSKKDETIEKYMESQKANKTKNADELWGYFCAVIDWVEMKFNYRKEMKGLEWGFFYNLYKEKALDKNELEEKIKELIDDDEVTNNKGIYEYLLSGDSRMLSLRSFDDKTKRKVYEAQKGFCVKCGGKFEIKEMEADHIIPWSKGGKTLIENCQMLCRKCNGRKSDK